MERQGTGIFATDERCIQFLDVMQNLMEKTLQEAYRVAANLKNHEGPVAITFTPHIAERYRYTLDLIAVWPSNIIAAEEERAKQLSVHILDCYRHLLQVYRQDFAENTSMPSFPSFLHEAYKQLVLLPEVRNGIYFQLFGWNRKGVIADAIRAALRSTGQFRHSSPPPPQPPVPVPAPVPASAPIPSTPAQGLLAPPPPAPQTTKAMLLAPPPSFPTTPVPATTPVPTPRTTKPSTVAAAFGRAIEIDLTRPDLGPPPTRPPTTKKG